MSIIHSFLLYSMAHIVQSMKMLVYESIYTRRVGSCQTADVRMDGWMMSNNYLEDLLNLFFIRVFSIRFNSIIYFKKICERFLRSSRNRTECFYFVYLRGKHLK